MVGGGVGGTEEAKLKKQEKAETSQFIEDLHLVFNGFFHFISPDFFKLANKLDQGGKHMGKNKVTTATKKQKTKKQTKKTPKNKKRKNPNKAVQISVTCTIALIWSLCLRL